MKNKTVSSHLARKPNTHNWQS